MPAILVYNTLTVEDQEARLLLKGLDTRYRSEPFCKHAGVPEDDVDLAKWERDICWDTDNDDLYRASNVDHAVGSETTTWTQIT